MYDKNSILEQLRAGVSADEIAAKAAEALNEAIAALTLENDAKLKREDQLNQYAENIAASITGYFKLAHDITIDEVPAQDIREMLDKMVPLYRLLSSLEVPAEDNKTKSDDEILLDFMKKFQF